MGGEPNTVDLGAAAGAMEPAAGSAGLAGADAAAAEPAGATMAQPAPATTAVQAEPPVAAEGAQPAPVAATRQTVPSPATIAGAAAAALERWLEDHIRNTPAARDTRIWNEIHGGVQTIKAALAAVQ